MVNDIKYFRELLDELLEVEEGLTAWEMNFLQDLSELEGDFTPGQKSTLERLYDRHL